MPRLEARAHHAVAGDGRHELWLRPAETLDLGKSGYTWLALTDAVASVAVGVTFVYAGTAVGRML